MRCLLIFVVLMAKAALADVVTVSMTNFVFIPADITINPGDTVVWRCEPGGVHDTVSGSSGVPSGLWNSGLKFPGQTFAVTFTGPGTFPYYCTPHWTLGMVGIVRVNAVNAPPTIVFSSPADQAIFSAPADVILEAVATDAEGGNISVEFFMNDTSIGVVAAPPHRLTLTDLAAGDYSFRAVATDSRNAMASAFVSITVTNPPSGTPPAITTEPQSQTVTAGTNLTLIAVATGSAPLEWQWFFNALPLAGATNSFLDLTNVQSADAGEYFVTVSNAFGLATSAVATLTVEAAPVFPAKNDFNHDGQTDFLWLRQDGRVVLWLMDGLMRVATVRLRNGRPAEPGARIVGTHDLDLDGNVDILWQQRDGSLRIWFMNGTNFLREEAISRAPALNRAWQAVGLADFDGNARADILLRHSEGYLLLWYMKGKRFLRQELVYNGKAIAPAWRVAGVADLDNNGHADILWQKSRSAMVVWFMGDELISPQSGPRLSNLPRVDGRIVGLNDLNQDGRLDFIWRDAQGHMSVWWMNGTNRLGSFPINHGAPVPSAFTLGAPGN